MMFSQNNTTIFSVTDQVYRYLSLTKPKIIVLLSLTGMIAYLLPIYGNTSSPGLFVFLIIGYLTAGGAMTINNYIDRDIDAEMIRTASRPSLGENAIRPLNILIFGMSFAGTGLIIGYLYFGPYTFIHLAWGVLFYILGYSMVLKRKSVLNTIIGGLASPAPVWAAVAARSEITGFQFDNQILGVPIEGWLLGALVFIWTPSHTWALSAKNIEDYTRAQIPMLPVKLGMRKTAWITLGFGIITITFGMFTGWYISQSMLFLLVLFIPNMIFIFGMIKFATLPSIRTANRCFKHHNVWLAIYFVLLLITTW